MIFRDRYEAGQILATKLTEYANRSDVIVLGLPRGGVPVAYEVAQALHVQLDVLLVRKLGVPRQPELALGAIAANGVRVLNESIVQELHIKPEVIDQIAEAEEAELTRRSRLYRDDRPPPNVEGRSVILVDDGLATGATMQAAVQAMRLFHPAQIVVAVPTAAPETCAAFRSIADDVICAETPEPFYAVGAWYADFSPTGDDEVRDLLARANAPYDGDMTADSPPIIA